MQAETTGDASHEETSQADTIEGLVALGFSRETLTALSPAIAATHIARYTAGGVIYHENTDIEALYVIRDGRIKLLNHLENGRVRIVRLHNRGSIIGLNGLMDDAHTHTAVAIDDVALYQIPMHLLKIVKHKDPDTYCKLLEYWNDYLNMADTWITDFSTGAIPGRVARLVRFLVEADEDTGPLEVTLLTVDEMADILGVTPESVSRTMAELKRKKILRLVDNKSPDHYRCNIKQLSKEAEK